MNQKGFSASIGLIILLVIAFMGGIGWYVARHNKPEQSETNTNKVNYVEATDSAKTFSFSYPQTWTIKPYEWVSSGDEGGPAKPEPDWTKETKPITLAAPNNKEVNIEIRMESYEYYGENRDDGKSFDDLLAFVKEDHFAKILFEGEKEDGHKALFTRVDYLGPPDAKVESFTDHRYYFDNGNTVLRVEFREKYHHDWPDDEKGPDINNSRYLPDFEHVVNSIKFIR